MDSELFTDGLKEHLLRLLAVNSFDRGSVVFEEQDGGQSLSIYVTLDNFNGDASADALLNLSKKIDAILPYRSDDYSWYVFFMRDGNIEHCYFGGNESSPKSGL